MRKMRPALLWLTGLLWLPALSAEPHILRTIYAVNVRRFFRLAIVMTVVHAIHVAAFAMKDVTGADAKVLLWRDGIIYSHALLALVTLIFALLCRPGRRQSDAEASAYSTFAVALYLTFGAVVAAIDQLVTPAVTPFLVASLGIGATVLLPPLRSFPLFVGAIALVAITAGYTQESPEKLLSLRVNALSMGLIGAGLNWALFSGKVRELRHLHTIEQQREDLALKNRALVRMNEARDRFLAIIAHDLRGPVGSQADAIDVLANEYGDMNDEERRSMLQSLQRSSRRSYELLEELLKWARSQTGRIPFRPETFSLTELIRETIDLVSDRARQKDIQVSLEVAGDPEVFADRSMIHSVLGNLIGNAIKFTPHHGCVTVIVESADDFHTVSVVDSGIGVPREQQDRLFQEGEPVRTTGTDGERGTGLGLVLSKQFVERNGGHIGVESMPFSGSRFYFTVQSARQRAQGVSSE
ncbi:MAG: hypothetical protein CVV45_05350 [Spirochaetae bacterium HGW-Spirochaetae-10]|nr:MAG: hypothetical protein CVV45_05350 [Spirochaetae bacterium HGW-Spirochaetae-10]